MKNEKPIQFKQIKPLHEANKEATSKKGRTFKQKALLTFNISRTIAIIVILAWCAYSTKVYFENYKWSFQTPIIVQNPLIIKPVNTINFLSPLGSPPASLKSGQSIIPQAYAYSEEVQRAEIIMKAKNAPILWRIYGLESTFGRADGCKDTGMINSFGFRQNSAEHKCYANFQEVVNAVDQWFTDTLKTTDLPTALCIYNEGRAISDCPYAHNYETLK